MSVEQEINQIVEAVHDQTMTNEEGQLRINQLVTEYYRKLRPKNPIMDLLENVCMN